MGARIRTYPAVALIGALGMLASASCATAPRAASMEFNPAMYPQVGIYVVSRREAELPPNLAAEAARGLRGKGYTIEEARVVSAPVGGTPREASETADSAIAARGAALGVSAMFVVTYMPLGRSVDIIDGPFPIEVRLGLVDVAQKQQVWNITQRANPTRGNEWDEAGYQLQLLMDRVPRKQ
jgi:hypothetical protein